MKKSHSFNVFSSKICATPRCHTRLKKRIAEEHPKFDYCFSCHKANERSRGHQMK